MTSWRRALGLVALQAAACQAAGGDDESGATEGSTGGETAPAPDFVEPASGRIDIPVTRTEDVVLGVTGVIAGVSRLEVDGINRGALGAGGHLGTLDAEALTLRLRGAMVPGVHDLQLVDIGGEDPLVSRVIEAHLQPVPPPRLVADLDDEVSMPGRLVASFGAAEHAVLVALDDTAPAAPLLRIVPLGAEGWDFGDAREITIWGYRRGPSEPGLAVAVERTGPAADPDDDRLRVAWRVGFPGQEIDLVDVRWGEADAQTPGAPAFVLDPAVLGPFEYAELRRPVLAGDTLVAEAYAPTDVEAPRPGDHALLTAHLQGRPAIATAPARLQLGDRQDIDAIGPALDVAGAEIDGPALLSARLDGRRPIVLRVEAATGRLYVRENPGDDGSRALSTVVGPLSAVLGAFGSRRVAGWAEGRVRLLEVDDWGQTNGTEVVLGPETIADPSGATGELAVGSLGGAPVWLLPYGPDAPVQAIVTGGEAPAVQTLEALRCGQIAIAFDPRDTAAQLNLACASGGEVRAGRLRADHGR